MKYVPHDGGGARMAGLLSGEVHAVSTGFHEAVDLVKAGEVRIFPMTALLFTK